MRFQEMRLRHKRSHMPCNLVNFILVNRELKVGRGRQQGEEKTRQKKKGVNSEKTQKKTGKEVWGDGISYHYNGFHDVQRCPIGSVSVQACRPRRGRSPAARQRGGEQEAGEEHVLPLYRGICACAEHVHVHAVHAMHAACLDKSALARPHATPCASAFLQVVVAVSFRVQEEMTMAMSRQNQFAEVFYTA